MNDITGKEDQDRVASAIAGAGVGAIVGLLSGATLWAVGATNLNVEPLPDALSTGAVLAGPVGMVICVIVGTLSGAIGAMIGAGRKSILSAIGSSIGGAMGGAIGGVIGSMALFSPIGGTTEFRLDGLVCGVGIFSGAFAGTIIGFVSGIAIARLGVRIGGPVALASTGFMCACSQFMFRPYSLTALIIALLIGLLTILTIEGIGRVRGNVAGMAIAEAARIGGLGAAIGGLFGTIGAVFFTFGYFWI